MGLGTARPRTLRRFFVLVTAVLATVTALATPVGAVPPNPFTASATATSASTIDLAWTDTGAPDAGIVITFSPTGPSVSVQDDIARTASVTGITPEQAYVVSVTATNGEGTQTATANITTVDEVASAPGAPTASNATATSVDLSWSAPANAGSAITSYHIFVDGVLSRTAATTSDTVSLLSPNTSYDFTVAAVNGAGVGPQSTATTASTTAGTAPGAFTVSSSAVSPTAVNLSWTDAGGSPVPEYTIVFAPTGPSAVVSGRTASVTGMTPGQSYTATVTASNSAGSSDAAATISADAAPSAPAAPTAGSITANSVELSWSAPSNTGSAITGYKVYVDGALVASPTGLSHMVTGLSAATGYSFQVAAVNGGGEGAKSAATTATTSSTAPGSFTITESPESGTSVNLTWTDPGGAPAPAYTVDISPSGPTASVSGLGATVTGMSPGVAYTVTITATNATESSVETIIVTANARPAVPGNVAAALDFGTDPFTVEVSWDEPTNTGTPITGYTIGLGKDGVALDPIEITAGDAPVSGGRATYVLESSLDRGEYTFTVLATNDAGDSAVSAASAPLAVPTSPGPTSITVLSVTPLGNGTFGPLPYGSYVTISWVAPEDTGGLPITHYKVEMAGLVADNVTATTATIGPLAAGTYTAKITAFTNAGSTQATSRQVVVKAFPPFDTRAEFVTQQYGDFLGRRPDAAGLNFYVNATASDTSNAAYLIATFMDSPEFAPRRSIVRLYQAYFGRQPDIGGFDFWAGQLASGASSVNHASASFAASAEFQRTYGSLSNAAFVDLVYSNVLGRRADAGGRAFWIGQLDAGLDRGSVMTNFSESPEYIAKTAAHVDVVMTYRGMLNRMPDTGGYAFWVTTVSGDRAQLLSLIRQFFVSAEYAARVNG